MSNNEPIVSVTVTIKTESQPALLKIYRKSTAKSDGLHRFFGQNRRKSGVVTSLAFFLHAFQNVTDRVAPK